jgi:hypothetical protein
MNTIMLENGKTVQLTITSSRFWIHFKSDQKLTEEEAIEAQIKFGYHPAGYGFYSFKGDTWSCADNCD